jgi:Xaa-Pro aminopeptidase
MGVEDGLRTVCSVTEIAQLEFAATRSSRAVWAVLRALRDGVTERELARQQQADGLPLSCHPMVSTGEKARRGLSSPSDRRVKLGDAFTTAVGLWGSLTARAGCVARGPDDVPDEARAQYEALSTNYFAVMTAWYAALRVGATGGEVFAAADGTRDDDLWSFALNPGHYIHLDEWVHSPFFRGSTIPLRSGNSIQMDIIPVSKGPFCTINGEDGVVLADAGLRRELASKFPDCFSRMRARQEFMRDRLGIPVDESVLPLSSYPAVLAPYLLTPELVLGNIH